MTITSHPENYTGIYSPVIYTISDVDPEVVTQVTVISPKDNVTPIGMKLFSGSDHFDVNVSNYYRRHLDPQPFFARKMAIYSVQGRHTFSSVAVGGAISDKTILTAGTTNGIACRLLSNAPSKLSISPDEFDELTFFAPGRTISAYITLMGKAGTTCFRACVLTCGEGLYSFVLNMRDVAAEVGSIEGYTRVRVELNDGGTTAMYREYDITAANNSSVRLCWLNPFGAIDYYTFSPILSESVISSKSRIYSSRGYEVQASEAERYVGVTSRCESKASMSWLAEVICSPKVWIADSRRLNLTEQEPVSGGECFVPVDIVTNSAPIMGESPVALALTMRSKNKEAFHAD